MVGIWDGENKVIFSFFLEKSLTVDRYNEGISKKFSSFFNHAELP
jgi:hypothetical protein